MAEAIDFRHSPGWAGRWERFQMAMEKAGVERKARTFCVAWVRKFMAFLKPRSSSQTVAGDVERFILLMAEVGKAGWVARSSQPGAEGRNAVGICGAFLNAIV